MMPTSIAEVREQDPRTPGTCAQDLRYPQRRKRPHLRRIKAKWKDECRISKNTNSSEASAQKLKTGL